MISQRGTSPTTNATALPALPAAISTTPFICCPNRNAMALAALYAFMRLVDDVADEGEDLAAKQRGLAKWRAALDDAVTGHGRSSRWQIRACSPAAALGARRKSCPRLSTPCAAINMPARYLHDLISGAEMDLTISPIRPSIALREYCYRVAGTVGLTCTHVFGFRDPRALDLAEKLGLAFQLTNIIRDVHEDYRARPRLSPRRRSARYGVSPEDFGRERSHARRSRTCCASKPIAPGSCTKKAPRFSV